MSHRIESYRTNTIARKLAVIAWMVVVAASAAEQTLAQSVCLPLPRLLTTKPMGAQAGSTVDVVVTGENLEQVDQLVFSHAGITAEPKRSENGKVVANTFVVTVVEDCPAGIHEARVMSRLGLSSGRVFSVGQLAEVAQQKPCTTIETAMSLEVNSVCNGVLTDRAVNHYRVALAAGQRVFIDCAARGIDSKAHPVVIVADADGQDLVVERRGGAMDFTAPKAGDYLVKVHELTFRGGPQYFFRLKVADMADSPDGKLPARMPGTRPVHAFSWPPAGLTDSPVQESEPNDTPESIQRVSLPLDLTGSFFPAADVDVFEFTANKGDVWWIEVGSQRLGRPTDPTVVVQQVMAGEPATLKDVIELSDIDSPIKRSSNGYSYDGPPYNAGSTDVLGKLEIPADGAYRLRLSDLFGGTRNDPKNVYRLVIRKAAPDFAVVSWGLHMNLRNGDRNALSKPLALRGGAGMALEVIAIRRDGFDGPIELGVEDLPAGVTAAPFTIPAGKSRGVLVLSAEQDAPRGWARTKLFAHATIAGTQRRHPIQLASMAWPVPNAWSEIPAPRLVADAPVSVGGSEFAAISLVPSTAEPIKMKSGALTTVPMKHVRRGEFSGKTISMQAFGAGFESLRVEVDLGSDQSKVDLSKLKLPPGSHRFSLYGKAVAKYKYNPDAVVAAEGELKLAEQAVSDAKGKADAESKAVAKRLAAAKAALAAAKKRAAPRDIVDIYVSEPVEIVVEPAAAGAKP